MGWQFLQATYDSQFEAFTQSTEIQREQEYFRENIADIDTAEDLVADRRLLLVALTAFGLEDDIDNKYFVQKVLEDGTSADDALANRLADDRYSEFSDAFGFGPAQIQRNKLSYFPDDILSQYQSQSFEVAVGEQDDTMRIALYGERKLVDLAAEDVSTDTQWYTIMGDSALRELFENALGLPSGISSVDVEKQLEIFKDKAVRMFGDDSVTQFTDPDKRDELVTAYTARIQIEQNASAYSSAATALQLLQASV